MITHKFKFIFTFLANSHKQVPSLVDYQTSEQLLFTQGWTFFSLTFLNTLKKDRRNLHLFICMARSTYIYAYYCIYRNTYVYKNVIGRSTALNSSVISLAFHAVYGSSNVLFVCCEFPLPTTTAAKLNRKVVEYAEECNNKNYFL